jgi:hypothetical protein
VLTYFPDGFDPNSNAPSAVFPTIASNFCAWTSHTSRHFPEYELTASFFESGDNRTALGPLRKGTLKFVGEFSNGPATSLPVSKLHICIVKSSDTLASSGGHLYRYIHRQHAERPHIKYFRNPCLNLTGFQDLYQHSQPIVHPFPPHYFMATNIPYLFNFLTHMQIPSNGLIMSPADHMLAVRKVGHRFNTIMALQHDHQRQNHLH